MPFKLLFKVLIELILPESSKETIVLASLYALLRDITDPCTVDISTLDKEILDLLIIPDAIKLPILCAPYIWGNNISYIHEIKRDLANEGAGLKPITPYAKELYVRIPFYLRYSARKADIISSLENIIRITCKVPFTLYAEDVEVQHIRV